MEIRNLQFLDKFMKGLIKRSPNISLTNLYRKTRNREEAVCYGDYPLLVYLVETLNKSGRLLSHDQLVRALAKSEEFCEEEKGTKSDILRNLESLQKHTIIASKGRKNIKGRK